MNQSGGKSRNNFLPLNLNVHQSTHRDKPSGNNYEALNQGSNTSNARCNYNDFYPKNFVIAQIDSPTNASTAMNTTNTRLPQSILKNAKVASNLTSSSATKRFKSRNYNNQNI